jgi:hypothetical protein
MIIFICVGNCRGHHCLRSSNIPSEQTNTKFMNQICYDLFPGNNESLVSAKDLHRRLDTKTEFPVT